MIGMIATPFLPCSNCQLSNCWRPVMFRTECVSCLLSCLVSHFGFVKAVGGWGTGGDLEGRRFCDLQTSNTCSLYYQLLLVVVSSSSRIGQLQQQKWYYYFYKLQTHVCRCQSVQYRGLMFPSLCSRPALFVPTWDDKDNNLIVNLDQDKDII